jgi:hypothetical protein
LHGSVTKPETIVLTRDDYLGYSASREALSAVVKATLITHHLLFVGFGLKDDHFHEIIHDVRRAFPQHATDSSTLEIFLDAILAFSTDSHSYLLAPEYEHALSSEERVLREGLLAFDKSQAALQRATPAWVVVERALKELGLA